MADGSSISKSSGITSVWGSFPTIGDFLSAHILISKSSGISTVIGRYEPNYENNTANIKICKSSGISSVFGRYKPKEGLDSYLALTKGIGLTVLWSAHPPPELTVYRPRSLLQLRAIFNGDFPVRLRDYYAGGKYVPKGLVGDNGPVPTTGEIKLSDFDGIAVQ